jgi:hypothetical protein
MTESNKIKTILKNLTNGQKYATNLIKEQELDTHFRHDELEAILQFHPDSIEKGVSNIDYLVVRTRQPYNTRSLFLKSHNNESEDDISYVICIQSMFNKLDQNKRDLFHITEAFQNAINNQNKINFLYANTRDVDGSRYGECSRCKQDVKACVDHYETSFKSILDTFCSTHKILISDVKVKWENNAFFIEDIAFRNKWIDYHDGLVQYRILCKSCNSSMGSYGYKTSQMSFNV